MKGGTPEQTGEQLNAFTTEHVFVTKANTPWRGNLLTRFYTYAKSAEIEDAHRCGMVDIHSLGVTFTTLSLEHGASPKAVQAILGHSTLALTMGVYARATDKAKRDAAGVLPFAEAAKPDHIISMANLRAVCTGSEESPETHSQERVTKTG